VKLLFKVSKVDSQPRSECMMGPCHRSRSPAAGSGHWSSYPFRFVLSGSVSAVRASGRGGRPFV